jgi:hypothetical protein
VGADSTLETVVREIEQIQETVCAPLRDGADAVREIYHRTQNEAMFTIDDLAQLQPFITAQLEEVRVFFGAGFAVHPDVLSGADLHEEWWYQGPNSRHRRLSVNRAYDYTKMSYFQQSEARYDVIVGPYLDFSGADRFIFTAAVPVLDSGKFLGMYGADITVPTFERLLTPVLRGVAQDLVLFNEDRRVVAATSAEFGPGDRVPEGAADAVAVAVGNEGARWFLMPAG